MIVLRQFRNGKYLHILEFTSRNSNSYVAYWYKMYNYPGQAIGKFSFVYHKTVENGYFVSKWCIIALKINFRNNWAQTQAYGSGMN